jgi:para-nitrobenzyl esterase
MDLPFVFRQLDHAENVPLVGDQPPAALSEAISSAWSTFAATGDPVVPGARWPEYEPTRRATIRWDAEIETVHDPRGGLRRWWVDALG